MSTPTLATIRDPILQAKMSLSTSKVESTSDRSLKSNSHWYSDRSSRVLFYNSSLSSKSSLNLNRKPHHSNSRSRNYQRARRVKNKMKRRPRQRIPPLWTLILLTKILRWDHLSPASRWMVVRASKAEERRNLRHLEQMMSKRRGKKRRSR